jgi:hypothetical protein
LKFIFAWASDWANLDFCEKQLGMTSDRAVNWRYYMRQVCAWKITKDHQVRIGGEGKTVEVDESAFFSGRKNHVGRMLPVGILFSSKFLLQS